MCFWNERKKINFSLKPVPSWHSLYSGWLVIYLYTYTYLIAIDLLERQRCLGRAGIPRQNPQVLHLQALLNSDGEYLDGTSWDASHFLQTSFLVEKHTHTDNFPLPASSPSQNTASKTLDHSFFPSLEEAAEMLILQLLSTVIWASGQDGLIASLAKRKK